MSRLLALFALCGSLAAISLAMNPIQEAGGPLENQGQEAEAEAQIPVVVLYSNTISPQEMEHWKVLNQRYGKPLDPSDVYESIKQIFDIRGDTRFRMGPLDSNLLLTLMKLRRMSNNHDCSLESLQNTQLINMLRLQNHVNLTNYIRHHIKRFLLFCIDYMTQSIDRMIENLGSRRRKRINELRQIYHSEIFNERLTTGVSKFVARYDWAWPNQNLPGSDEHRALFEVKFKSLFEDTCRSLLEGFMPWVLINRRLLRLRLNYLGNTQILNKYTSKWIRNARVCSDMNPMQDPNNPSFRRMYEKYVSGKMTNPAQLYPRAPT